MGGSQGDHIQPEAASRREAEGLGTPDIGPRRAALGPRDLTDPWFS